MSMKRVWIGAWLTCLLLSSLVAHAEPDYSRCARLEGLEKAKCQTRIEREEEAALKTETPDYCKRQEAERDLKHYPMASLCPPCTAFFPQMDAQFCGKNTNNGWEKDGPSFIIEGRSIKNVQYFEKGKQLPVPKALQDAVAKYNAEQSATVASGNSARDALIAKLKATPINCPSGTKVDFATDVTLATANGADQGFRKACMKVLGMNQVNDGPTIVWYPNGNKALEAHYVDGKPEGLVKEWNEDGTPMRESNYKNGRQHGTTTTWSKNGDFKTTNFENGLPNGREFGVAQGSHFESVYDHGRLIKHDVLQKPASN